MLVYRPKDANARHTSEYLCQVERVARALANELEGDDDCFRLYEGCAAAVIEAMYANGSLVAMTRERITVLKRVTRHKSLLSADDSSIVAGMIEEVRLSGHEYRFGSDESLDESKVG